MQTVPRLYETFQPSHYNLSLTLNRTARTFSGQATIQGNYLAEHGDIRLHSKELAVSKVTVDETDTPFELDQENDLLVIHTNNTTAGGDVHISGGDVHISIDFNGAITDGMHGLYPCYYEVASEKKELLATQFESHHAREVFPCIDEPEAKATFDLTLTTEAGVEVLSNMPVKEQVVNPAHIVTSFETSPRMSTYLLAFVVGELQKKTAKTKGGVEVNVWATLAQPASALDFPLEVATRSIDFFNEYFQTPYPLPKADHIALPDFSSGAMENWGLITYREIALLVDANSSISMREYVATVITHETSHQWFGNLVTMKWWNDLWLNESFATIMEYVAVDALYPEWRAWDTFASQETLSALRRDQIAGVQAVKTEVNHPDEISTLFDPSIVYAKGGRLLKMLRSYIGEDAFRSGLQAYFAKHAYGNTEGVDLWHAFSEASGKDVETFMDLWLSQSGFPLVNVQTNEGGYTLSQERFIIGGEGNGHQWPIPLFSSNSEFPEILSDKEVTFLAKKTLPLLNAANDAHFITHYDAAAWQLVISALAKGELDPVARLSLLHETSLLARGGKADTATLIPLLHAYVGETSEPVWNIISMIIADLKRFVEDDEVSERQLKQLVTSIAFPLYEKLGFEAKDGEPEEETKLRATIIGLLSYSEYPEVISRGLEAVHETAELESLPGETRAIILAIAAKYGTSEDFARLVDLHANTPSAELRDDITAGLCAVRDVPRIQELLERLTSSDLVKHQDLFRWYVNLLRNRYAREQTWQWMVDNWSWIEQTFKGDKSYDDFARYSANILSTRAWLDIYTTFFDPMLGVTALKRAIEIGKVEIATRADWLERDAESVRATLAQETA